MMDGNHDATATLHTITAGFPDLLRQLSELDAAGLPDGLGPAITAWQDATLRLLTLATRARLPARERAAAMGEELATLEDAGSDGERRQALESERMQLNCETVFGDWPEDISQAFEAGYRIAKEGGTPCHTT